MHKFRDVDSIPLLHQYVNAMTADFISVSIERRDFISSEELRLPITHICHLGRKPRL